MLSQKKKRIEPEPILEFSGPNAHLIDNGHGIPIRTCVLERKRKEKPFLLRFVLSPQGEVVPDIKGDLPGRGVWLTATKNVIEEAVRRRAFQRGFKKPVNVRQDLAAQIEQLLKRSALERLSIANKAGLVVVGFVKVEEAIRRGEIISLLHANTAAKDGQTKLDRKFAAVSSGKDHIPLKNCFTSEEISLAAGSANVIHAGLKEGGASRAFLKALERLSDYCTGEEDTSPCQGKE
jgi:predicted RNA-binding protein YlxR (DUF448 family)